MKKLLLAGVALAGLALAPAAEAAITIVANGATVASSASNGQVLFSGEVGGFSNVVVASGANLFGGNGVLMDNASVNILSDTIGSVLTLVITQTDLSLASGLTSFETIFTGTITNATVSRSWFFDADNTGAQATLLGTTNVGNAVFAGQGTVNGLFSLTEVITVTASGIGAILSSDDKIRVPVPEPMSLTLFGAGLLGLGLVRRRKA